MTSYKIQSWNPVAWPGTSNNQVPMVTIIPDIGFVEFAKNNNYSVLVRISGTGQPAYENKLILANVGTTATVPNCRPNFYAATGLWSLTLCSGWFGWPGTNGTVIVSGYKP